MGTEWSFSFLEGTAAGIGSPYPGPSLPLQRGQFSCVTLWKTASLSAVRRQGSQTCTKERSICWSLRQIKPSPCILMRSFLYVTKGAANLLVMFPQEGRSPSHGVSLSFAGAPG